MTIEPALIASAPTQPIAMSTSTAAPEQYWRSDALCSRIDPDLFFPEKGDAGQVGYVSRYVRR